MNSEQKKLTYKSNYLSRKLPVRLISCAPPKLGSPVRPVKSVQSCCGGQVWYYGFAVRKALGFPMSWCVSMYFMGMTKVLSKLVMYIPRSLKLIVSYEMKQFVFEPKYVHKQMDSLFLLGIATLLLYLIDLQISQSSRPRWIVGN